MKTGCKTRLYILFILIFGLASYGLTDDFDLFFKVVSLNTNQQVKHGNKISMITHEIVGLEVVAEVTNNSTGRYFMGWLSSDFRDDYPIPDYVEGWEDQETELISPGEQKTLKNVIFIRPQTKEANTIRLWCGIKENDKTIHMNVIIFHVRVQDSPFDHPIIVSEPIYTRGLTNTVSWIPTHDSRVQDIYIFDPQYPENLVMSIKRLYKGGISSEIVSQDTIHARFNSLENGRKYGYFAKSEYGPENEYHYMYSDITYSIQDNTPPDPIVEPQAILKGNNMVEVNWNTVEDSLSGVKSYQIYRAIDTSFEQMVDSVLVIGPQPVSMQWTDQIDTTSTYYYRIRAVDQVGNLGIGDRSNGISISGDPVNPLPPDNGDPVINPDISDTLIIKGCEDTLYIAINGREKQIRFEAVRDSLSYFNMNPNVGMRYFDSGWLDKNELLPHSSYSDLKGWIFYYSKQGEIDRNFVNGHHYIRRAIKKYSAGADTVWFGTAIPDCYPPEDIHNLRVEAVIDDPSDTNPSVGYSTWHFELTRKHATDDVSGLKRYHIFRKIKGMDFEFLEIECAEDYLNPFFKDTLHIPENVMGNTPVFYRVVAEDRLGQQRQINETDWEVSDRALKGPSIEFETGNGFYQAGQDTIFTNKGYVILKITDFNRSEVQDYVVSVNGIQKIHNNKDQDTLQIYLPEIEVTKINVRALYLGKRSSIWSKEKVVIQTSTSPPVLLEVKNKIANWEGDIYLKWTRPSLDVVGYEVYRKEGVKDSIFVGLVYSEADTISWIDYYDQDELTGQQTTPLVAYEYYTYQVLKINVLDERSQFTEPKFTYCNRAPVIVNHDNSSVTNGHYAITIRWKRAKPTSVATGFETTVNVFQNNLGQLIETAVIKNDDTVYTYFNADVGSNYLFRVQENPNDQPMKSSSWSQRYTVSLDTIDIAALVQPKGNIFVFWADSTRIQKYRVNSFQVCRDQTCWLVPVDSTAFMDFSLNHGQSYEYSIFALDSLDQIVAANSKIAVCDTGSVFIPEINPFDPMYFNSDSIEVHWTWRDIEGDPLTLTTRGATTCSLEVSVSRTFPRDILQTNRIGPFEVDPTVRSHKVAIPVSTNRENEALFFRITAWDPWGHPSEILWSNEFYKLKKAVYDTIFPKAVHDQQVTSITAYHGCDNMVIVHLNWSGEGVQWAESKDVYLDSLIDNVAKYRIEKKFEQLVTPIKEVSVNSDTNYIYEYPDTVQNKIYQWRIVAIDIAGNETASPWIESPEFVKTPNPPILRDYKACSVELLEDHNYEYFIEIAVNQDHFNLAYDIDNGGMVERLLCQSGWITGPHFVCSTGWGSMQVDTTWFRIKARKIGLSWESGWSSQVFFTGGGSFFKNQDGLWDQSSLPSTFNVYQNFPNPFNAGTMIFYQIPEKAEVKIIVYNIRGALVRSLKDEFLNPGYYFQFWDGKDVQGYPVASGIYVLQIVAVGELGNGYQRRMKMIIMK